MYASEIPRCLKEESSTASKTLYIKEIFTSKVAVGKQKKIAIEIRQKIINVFSWNSTIFLTLKVELSTVLSS